MSLLSIQRYGLQSLPWFKRAYPRLEIKITQTICLLKLIANDQLSSSRSAVCSQNIEQVWSLCSFLCHETHFLSVCPLSLSFLYYACCVEMRGLFALPCHTPPVFLLLLPAKSMTEAYTVWIDIPPMVWIWAPHKTYITHVAGKACHSYSIIPDMSIHTCHMLCIFMRFLHIIKLPHQHILLVTLCKITNHRTESLNITAFYRSLKNAVIFSDSIRPMRYDDFSMVKGVLMLSTIPSKPQQSIFKPSF